MKAVRHFIASYSRPSLDRDHVARLRQMTDRPVLLKGILHADDARKAVSLGVDGVKPALRS